MTLVIQDLDKEKLLREKELLLQQGPGFKTNSQSFAYRLRKLLKIEKRLSNKSHKP